MLRTLCVSVISSTLCILALPAIAAGPVDEPYAVYVNEDGSYTRCGPSPEHYRTDRLSEGDALEVYLETDDGWLGIRPPESSFCWLPSDQVQLDANGRTGKIIDADAVSWIGTNLGQARKYRWQVQFQIGEPVTVIGETERETASGEKETWYRIVPPPGEFRWVHDSQIVRSREALAKSQIKRRSDAVADATPQRRDQPLERNDPPSITGSAPATFDSQAALDQIAAAGGSVMVNNQPAEDQVAQVVHESPRDDRAFQSRLRVAEDVRMRDMQSTKPERTEPAQSNSAWIQAARPSPPIDRPASDNLHASKTIPRGANDKASVSLQHLQVEFARMIASSDSPQQLDILRTQVETLIQTANDPVDRGRARLLVERIVKFQEIASNRAAGANPAQTSSPVPMQSSPSNSYDREGWLVQVYSSRSDAPPFALTDRDGKMIAYVSPAAGLNPRRLLNQEVGIIGKPSMRTGLDTPHFVAEQIVRVRR